MYSSESAACRGKYLKLIVPSKKTFLCRAISLIVFKDLSTFSDELMYTLNSLPFQVESSCPQL